MGKELKTLNSQNKLAEWTGKITASCMAAKISHKEKGICEYDAPG